MSETIVQKLSRFGALVVAHFKGDNDEVIRIKNESRAKASIEQQIGALKLQISNQQDRVDAAQDAFNVVFAPTTVIKDSQAYINNLAAELKKVKVEQKTLKDLEGTVEAFEQLLAEFVVPTA